MEMGCSQNNMTYTYILTTTEKPRDVINLIQRMEESGCKLDCYTYNLILNLYVSINMKRGTGRRWRRMDQVEISGHSLLWLMDYIPRERRTNS
jgi:hypothetical protein